MVLHGGGVLGYSNAKGEGWLVIGYLLEVICNW
jgi:hypothetical protein